MKDSAARADARVEEHLRANEDDLLRYFQRRLANGADAAEAFGELMLTAWKSRRKMPQEQAEARMWLFGVARNVLRDTRRSLARRSAAVGRLVDEMKTFEPIWDDAAVELRDAIGRLPEADAELVRLVYWDGFTSYEAAAVLGINPSTARSRLSRARERLQGALTQEFHTAAHALLDESK